MVRVKLSHDIVWHRRGVENPTVLAGTVIEITDEYFAHLKTVRGRSDAETTEELTPLVAEAEGSAPKRPTRRG